MNESQHISLENIPVLSDIVIPGSRAPGGDAPLVTVPGNGLAEHLKTQADALLAEMRSRVEQMVEEELLRANAAALETVRLALQTRLGATMEERLNAFIAAALRSNER